MDKKSEIYFQTTSDGKQGVASGLGRDFLPIYVFSSTEDFGTVFEATEIAHDKSIS